MPADFLYALFPEHALLGLVVVLMVLETLRAGPGAARTAFLVAVVAGAAVLVRQIDDGFTATVVPDEIRIDRLALLGRLVILACGLALGVALPVRDSRFWMLVAASLLGGLVVLDSAGFAALFLGIELASLPAFALMVHGRERSGAGAAGAFQYLLMSSVGTALLLLGIAIHYGSTGSLAIAPFARTLGATDGVALAATLLVLAGLLVKLAVFPFHAWAPDAYAAARLPVTAVLASAVKAAVALALLRIVADAPLAASTGLVVAAFAIASIVVGNLAALGQLRFRRLMAWSSIAHAGYMAIALLDTTGARVDDLLWYVVVYALATLLACASFAAICGADDDCLERLEGAFARSPVAAVLLAVAVLSLAGLPPFPGFFAKLLVFRSVIASGYLATAILAFVGSFLGLAVYVGLALRMVRPAAAPASAPADAEQGAKIPA
ncbi:MAG: hypothetical protein MUF56_08835 [Solirubrobacteraceae bacterium]|nr:hypothetical protein [Solirubrobacteraceae bacterium]